VPWPFAAFNLKIERVRDCIAEDQRVTNQLSVSETRTPWSLRMGHPLVGSTMFFWRSATFADEVKLVTVCLAAVLRDSMSVRWKVKVRCCLVAVLTSSYTARMAEAEPAATHRIA